MSFWLYVLDRQTDKCYQTKATSINNDRASLFLTSKHACANTCVLCRAKGKKDIIEVPDQWLSLWSAKNGLVFKSGDFICWHHLDQELQNMLFDEGEQIQATERDVPREDYSIPFWGNPGNQQGSLHSSKHSHQAPQLSAQRHNSQSRFIKRIILSIKNSHITWRTINKWKLITIAPFPSHSLFIQFTKIHQIFNFSWRKCQHVEAVDWSKSLDWYWGTSVKSTTAPWGESWAKHRPKSLCIAVLIDTSPIRIVLVACWLLVWYLCNVMLQAWAQCAWEIVHPLCPSSGRCELQDQTTDQSRANFPNTVKHELFQYPFYHNNHNNRKQNRNDCINHNDHSIISPSFPPRDQAKPHNDRLLTQREDPLH